MPIRLPSERVNFLTHAGGFLAWIPLGVLLVARVWSRPDLVLVSAVYTLSVLFLFFASANYHYFKTQENEVSFRRKMDHIAIFVMIAGSYTPVVYVWFDDPWRIAVLALQWGITALGLIYKLAIDHPPRWIAPVMYLAMGWVALGALVPLYRVMPHQVFFEMLGGGLVYSVGAVIYAIKKPNPVPGTFGFHEIFHVCILIAAAVHFAMEWETVIAAL